jgi:branched-chain amino acid transport system substrate-binding protein
MLIPAAARRGAIGTLLCTAAVGLAACGSSSSKSASAGASSGSSPSTTAATSAPATGTAVSGAALTWGVNYVAGTAGKADASKPPFVLGWANQQGGTPAYPGATIGADAAVSFINNQLGGINGRPLKLDKCFMLTEEDGQKCGAKFLGDNVQGVILGLAAVGNASLYKTIVPKLPVIVATAAAQPDQVTSGVYSLNGGSLAPIAADALLAAKVPGAKKSAVMYSSNAIGTFVAEKVLAPVLRSEHLGVSLVPISDTATAPEVASAIQAASARDAQVFQMTTLPAQCTAAYDALKQQGITPKVVTTYECSRPLMLQHLAGKEPAGWVFTNFIDSPAVANATNGQQTYVAAMHAAGQPSSQTLDDEDTMGFISIMEMSRFANQLKTAASPSTLKAAIVNYHGPLMMTPGTPHCGKVSKTFIGICTTIAPVTQANTQGVLQQLAPVDAGLVISH